jgi:hypothetical protein
MKILLALFCIVLPLGCSAKSNCEEFINQWSKNSVEYQEKESYFEMLLAFDEQYGNSRDVINAIEQGTISDSELNIIVKSHGHYLLNQSIIKKKNNMLKVLLDKGVSIYQKNSLMNAPILELALNKDKAQLQILNKYMQSQKKQHMKDVLYYVDNCKGQLQLK